MGYKGGGAPSLPCFFPEVAETPSLWQDVLVGCGSLGQCPVDVGWGTTVVGGFPGFRFHTYKMGARYYDPGATTREGRVDEV